MQLLSHLLLLCLLGAIDLAFTNSSPIRILTNNWTSQFVIAYIAGQLLNLQGYTVEYVNSSVDDNRPP